MKKKTTITMSRLNGTGVQKFEFRELKVDSNIYFEGEKYRILGKKIGAKGKWKISDIYQIIN